MNSKPGFFHRFCVCWFIITQKYDVCVEKCEVCGSYHTRTTSIWQCKNKCKSVYYECQDCGSVFIVNEHWKRRCIE